jgi:hypothetical protein
MRGIPPHLLPPTPNLDIHFRCWNCGYDNFGVTPVRCPECGSRARDGGVPFGRAMLLAWMIFATALGTWMTYEILWASSDFMQGVPRILDGMTLSNEVLHDLCFEECWIRALLVALSGFAVCLFYAYFFVFERAHAHRMMSRLTHWAGFR